MLQYQAVKILTIERVFAQSDVGSYTQGRIAGDFLPGRKRRLKPKSSPSGKMPTENHCRRTCRVADVTSCRFVQLIPFPLKPSIKIVKKIHHFYSCLFAMQLNIQKRGQGIFPQSIQRLMDYLSENDL